MNMSDKIDYIKLKDTLSFSDFQIYVFLRVQVVTDSYMSHSLQFTRTVLRPYLYDIDGIMVM